MRNNNEKQFMNKCSMHTYIVKRKQKKKKKICLHIYNTCNSRNGINDG